MSNINNVADISDIESETGPEDEIINTENKSMVPATESGQPLLRLVNTLQNKFKSLPAIINSRNKLPAELDSSNMAVASKMLSHKFTTAYSEESYEKSVRELSIITLGIIGFIFVSVVGWKVTREINFINGGDFIYNTGLMGGILMLLTLIYSIIKRVGYLSRRLSSTQSYYFHIICGGTGALLIVIHSSFDFRSINSNVAMFSMLFIIISGALGRYLYTQFTLLLHRLYLKVNQTEQAMYNNIAYYNCNAAKQVNTKLSQFAQHSFKQPENIPEVMGRYFSIISLAIYTYTVSIRDIYKIIKSASVLGDMKKDEIRRVKKEHRRQIGNYILDVSTMGYLNLLERVFKHWRVLHVPFLYILFLTSIAHVIVVHMY